MLGTASEIIKTTFSPFTLIIEMEEASGTVNK
jgi:hypothetical protein